MFSSLGKMREPENRTRLRGVERLSALDQYRSRNLPNPEHNERRNH